MLMPMLPPRLLVWTEHNHEQTVPCPKFERSTSKILSCSTRTPLACHVVMQLSKWNLPNSLVRRCNITCLLHRRAGGFAQICGC
jgi:hypothetical protein